MSRSSDCDNEDRIFTEQLALRPLVDGDARTIAAYLSDWDVVKQTVTVPFPYDERSALTWIARVRRRHNEGRQFAFAITRRADDLMVGAVALSLIVGPTGTFGEIGYWLGKPHWGQGFASEAVGAITEFGLETLGLGRIEALTFKENKPSRRVLEKAGFRLDRTETRRYPDRGGKRKVLLFAARRDDQEGKVQ